MCSFMDRSEVILFLLGCLAVVGGVVMLTIYEPSSDPYNLGRLITGVSGAVLLLTFTIALIRFLVRQVLARASSWQGRPVLESSVRRLEKELSQATKRSDALYRKMTNFREQYEAYRDAHATEEEKRKKYEQWWHEEREEIRALEEELSETRSALQREVRRTMPQLEPISPEPPGTTLHHAFPYFFDPSDAGDMDKAIAFLNGKTE